MDLCYACRTHSSSPSAYSFIKNASLTLARSYLSCNSSLGFRLAASKYLKRTKDSTCPEPSPCAAFTELSSGIHCRAGVSWNHHWDPAQSMPCREQCPQLQARLGTAASTPPGPADQPPTPLPGHKSWTSLAQAGQSSLCTSRLGLELLASCDLCN